MIKKIVIGVFSTLLVAATAAGVYNTVLSKDADTTAAQAQELQTVLDPVSASDAGLVTPQPEPLGQGPAWQQDEATAPRSGGQGLSRGAQDQSAIGTQNFGSGGAGSRGGRGRQGARGSQAAGGQQVPQPQNGFTEWVVFEGTVTSVTLPDVVLTTPDGQQISVQLGNQSYAASLGLDLQVGDNLTVTGYWEPTGAFAVGTLTDNTSGAVFALRDDLGRPLWAGGPSR